MRIAVAVAALVVAGGLGFGPAPWTASAARAQPVGQTGTDPGARVRQRLERGYAQFVDLEYRAAIRTLAPIPRDGAATRAQRVRALELIGLSHLILGEEAPAREAFEDLLAIDPGYQLRDDTGSPKIRDFFDEVKRAYVPGFDSGAVAELEHAAPAAAVAARRVEFEVRVTAGAGAVVEVIVYWRRRGVLDYDRAPMRQVRDGQWRTRFTPPASSARYAIEYYVEATDLGGRAVGRVGGPQTPLALPVAAGQRDRAAWYRRWYVVAGGAAVVGLGTVILVSGDRAPDGSLEPGPVILTP